MTTTERDNDDTFLYFAYGSNLLKTRIHINNPSAEFYDVAKLQVMDRSQHTYVRENGEPRVKNLRKQRGPFSCYS